MILRRECQTTNLVPVIDDEPLTIATDGSCLGNPGPGGWSWAVSDSCWSAGGHPSTTNNLMELRAVYEALAATPPRRPLIIETDSEYVINVFTKWLEGWRANNWRTSGRRPVANQAAILEIDRRLAGRSIAWQHVYGHSGHHLNEIVDYRARTAAVAVREGRRIETGKPDCARSMSQSDRGDCSDG